MLLVDVGNTRIKWARLDGTQAGASHAAVHASWSTQQFARHLFGGFPQDLLVSCVAGAAVRAALERCARSASVRARFVRVPRAGAGVRVAYLEPWRLGVDRYVGMVGAVELLAGSAVCVVGVGTALTLDLVDARGRHRGGAIIPSPDLMVQTLFAGTHGIRRRAQGGRGSSAGKGALFGRSTKDGVVQGGRFAAAALVDRAVAEAARMLQKPPLVVLTGGGAPAVSGLIHSPVIGVPDLVLKGLAVLARPMRRADSAWE